MINRIISDKTKLGSIHLLLFWLAITSASPFIFYAWPWHPYKKLLFVLLSVFLIQITTKRKVLFSIYPTIVLLIMSLYSFFKEIYHQTTDPTFIFQNIGIFILYVYLVSFVKVERFVKSYIIVIIAMGVGGTITFFMSYLFGVKPLFEVGYGNNGGISYFFGLTSSNSFIASGGGWQFIRYSGFFDEPGAFGLYAMYALALNKVFFNNRKLEVALLIFPLFCFSLGFYIVFLLYSVFFLLNKRTIKYFVLIIVLTFSLFRYVNGLDSSDAANNYLYERTVGRFALDNSGQWNNSSRAVGDELGMAVFRRHPLLGDGKTSGASIALILGGQGLVGVAVLFFVLQVYLFLIVKSKVDKGPLLKILLMIALSYYHRPQNTTLSLLIAFSLMHNVLDARRDNGANNSLII